MCGSKRESDNEAANTTHIMGLNGVGRLAPGYRAAVLVLDAPNWRYFVYHLGGDRLAAKIKSGG